MGFLQLLRIFLVDLKQELLDALASASTGIDYFDLSIFDLALQLLLSLSFDLVNLRHHLCRVILVLFLLREARRHSLAVPSADFKLLCRLEILSCRFYCSSEHRDMNIDSVLS